MADRTIDLRLRIVVDSKGAVTGIKTTKGETVKLGGAVDKTEEKTKKMGRSFGSLRMGMLGVVAAFAGVALGIKKVIGLAGIQEAAEKKLETALGYRSQALLDNAAALQQASKFGDENIILVQASIAAFTKDEETIKRATQATLDMAEATGMDLKAAGDLISKTIGSSTNAMARYGVEVEGAVGSQERLEMMTTNIANLWGGQAAAATETMSGKLQQAKNAIGDAGEALGELLIPAVVKIAGVVKIAAEGLVFYIDKAKEWSAVLREKVGGAIAGVLDIGITMAEKLPGFLKKAFGIDEEDLDRLRNLRDELAGVADETDRLTISSEALAAAEAKGANIQFEKVKPALIDTSKAMEIQKKGLIGITGAREKDIGVAMSWSDVQTDTAQNFLNSIRRIIRGLMAEAVARAVAREARKGLAGIITAALAGAGFVALFDRLIPKFQYGGQFTVPGTGGPDSQTVILKATPREEFFAVPPGGWKPLPMPGGGGLASSAQLERLAQAVERNTRAVSRAQARQVVEVVEPSLYEIVVDQIAPHLKEAAGKGEVDVMIKGVNDA